MAKQDSLDPQTRDLVRFAAAIAQGYEPELRERVGPLRVVAGAGRRGSRSCCSSRCSWCGYPRALVAFRVWRKFSGVPRARRGCRTATTRRLAEWTRRGEETCAVVYGDNYRKLRDSVRDAAPGRGRVDDHRGLRPHARRGPGST